jgi:hypothetical protein
MQSCRAWFIAPEHADDLETDTSVDVITSPFCASFMVASWARAIMGPNAEVTKIASAQISTTMILIFGSIANFVIAVLLAQMCQRAGPLD